MKSDVCTCLLENPRKELASAGGCRLTSHSCRYSFPSFQSTTDTDAGTAMQAIAINLRLPDPPCRIRGRRCGDRESPNYDKFSAHTESLFRCGDRLPWITKHVSGPLNLISSVVISLFYGAKIPRTDLLLLSRYIVLLCWHVANKLL